jgi:uncharacterized membrane protein
LGKQTDSDSEIEKRALRNQRIILLVMLIGMVLPFVLAVIFDAFNKLE